MVSRLVESSACGGLCPTCHRPFDSGQRRRLVDSCGHHRCYSCLFLQEECPVCRGPGQDQENIGASRLRGADSRLDPDCLYGSVRTASLPRAPKHLTPSSGRRVQASPAGGRALASPAGSKAQASSAGGRTQASPAGGRRNWVHKYNRRPQTVSVDDATMSGEGGVCRNVNTNIDTNEMSGESNS